MLYQVDPEEIQSHTITRVLNQWKRWEELWSDIGKFGKLKLDNAIDFALLNGDINK